MPVPENSSCCRFDLGKKSITCEKEQPEAVKQNILNQEHCAKESLYVSLETFIDDGNINGKAVNSTKPSRDVENVVNIINSKIIS